jgi:zinc and cadmium transporter
MATLLAIILATFSISLCVWAAVLFLYFKKETLDKITIFLVSLSAGALTGGAFLHLLPEAAEELESELLFGVFLASFVFFFLLEKIIHWRHCHKADCKIHSFGYMNLAGDAVHNFIDGLPIASTFMVNPALGISTTLAVAIHEIPQEIGDFGVLVYSGFKKKTALLINCAVAMTVVAGATAGYFFFSYLQSALPYLLPFAAGGFVYIAASDLMPEIRKEMDFKKSMVSFSVFIAGILMMYLVKLTGE